MMCAAARSSEDAIAAGQAAMAALGVAPGERAALAAELGADVTRQTPTRRRLFRLLAGRAARRRPLLLLPVVHGVEPPSVSVREARSLERAEDGRLLSRRASRPAQAAPAQIDAFAAAFVQENFR